MIGSVYSLVYRPNLSHLPQSVNLVYDVVAASANSQGYSRMTLAEIGAVIPFSRKTIRLALKRLLGGRYFSLVRRGRWRGSGMVIFVRIFQTSRKLLKKAVCIAKEFSTGKGVTPLSPPLHPPSLLPSENNLKTPRSRSKGQIMGDARGVLEKNPDIDVQTRQVILSTLGRMLFRERYFPVLTARPGAIDELLHRFSAISARPFVRTELGRVYRWARWMITDVFEQCRATPGAVLMAELGLTSDHLLETCADGSAAATRSRGVGLAHPTPRSPRRRSWSERGKVPSWGTKAIKNRKERRKEP